MKSRAEGIGLYESARISNSEFVGSCVAGRVRRFQKKWNRKPNRNRPLGTETEPEPIFFSFLELEPNRNRSSGTGAEPEPVFFQFRGTETGTGTVKSHFK